MRFLLKGSACSYCSIKPGGNVFLDAVALTEGLIFSVFLAGFSAVSGLIPAVPGGALGALGNAAIPVAFGGATGILGVGAGATTGEGGAAIGGAAIGGGGIGPAGGAAAGGGGGSW